MNRKIPFPKFDAFLVVLGFVLAVLCTIAAFSVSKAILDRFYDSQQKAAIAQAKGVLHVLTMDFQNFSDHLSDYSYWDETCEYIAGNNPDFLKKNFNATSFYFTRLDLAMIFTADFRFLGGVYESSERQLDDVPPEIIARTKELQPLFDVEHSRHSRIGFLNSPSGIFMLVARPVADSNAVGPIRGFVVFGRRLDEEQLQLLSTLTGLSIKLTVQRISVPHNDGKVVESQMLGGAQIVLSDTQGKDSDTLDAKVVLHDIQGECCYRLEITPPENAAESVQRMSNLIRLLLVAVALGFALLSVLSAWEFRRRRQELIRRIRAQEALEQSIVRAEKLAEQAQSADRAKGDFLAMISHEIRTPLNAIIGFVGLIEEGKLEPQQAAYLKNINTGSELLLGILSDILDFSRIDAGHVDIHLQSQDIREIVEAVRGLYAVSAREKDDRIEVRIAEDIPPYVHVDGIRLGQVLGNLVSNAVKFTDSGVITLSAEVMQGEERDGEIMLSFSVQDTGIGIPEEHRDKLFKSFSQVDSTRSRRYGGTGLGLVICRRLVERMGGTIELKPSTTGTHVVFTLRAAVSESPEQSSFDFPRPQKSLSGNVLIVDDNKTNAQLLGIILKKFGVASSHVESGKEALHACASHPFHLILMDLQMPGMDGVETTRAIREMEARRSLPPSVIVAVTAAATVTDRENCLAAGMNDYITKPYRPGLIEDIIKKYLSPGT